MINLKSPVQIVRNAVKYILCIIRFEDFYILLECLNFVKKHIKLKLLSLNAL